MKQPRTWSWSRNPRAPWYILHAPGRSLATAHHLHNSPRSPAPLGRKRRGRGREIAPSTAESDRAKGGGRGEGGLATSDRSGIPSRGGDGSCQSPPGPSSWSGILLDHTLHLSLVSGPILLVEVVGVRLGGRVWIGVVEQVLHAQKDLSDRDGRFPAVLFVEDGEADGAGRVDVRMKQWRRELACGGYQREKRSSRSWGRPRRGCRTHIWVAWSDILEREPEPTTATATTIDQPPCCIDQGERSELSRPPRGHPSSPSGKVTSSLKRPPSHKVFSLPGIPHSHLFRSSTPCPVRCGLAKNPKG